MTQINEEHLRYGRHTKIYLIEEDYGFLCYKLCTDENVEIDDIEIKEEMRGKGYGTILFKKLLSKFARDNFRPVIVFVWTKSDNIVAQKFYEKLGFIKCGEAGDNWIYWNYLKVFLDKYNL